jgi:hypothetical protein
MIEIAIAGAAGGFVKSLVEQKGRVVLPKIEEADGAKYVHLGVMANMVLGLAVSFYTAADPATAFTAGITAAFFAEKLLERTPMAK